MRGGLTYDRFGTQLRKLYEPIPAASTGPRPVVRSVFLADGERSFEIATGEMMVPSCLQAILGGFTHAANLHHLVGALAYAKLATSQTASRSISFGFAVDRLLDVKRQQRQLAPSEVEAGSRC